MPREKSAGDGIGFPAWIAQLFHLCGVPLKGERQQERAVEVLPLSSASLVTAFPFLFSV